MEASKIKDVVVYLESLAPIAYQESYDNSGLQTGDPEAEVSSILVTLDCTEEVVEEARQLGANLIVSHHPILFRGLKKITGTNYVERTLLKAIKQDIAIYSAHTNLDNIHEGVNRKIAEKLGLRNTRILQPRHDSLSKLVTFVPTSHRDQVLEALSGAGAGQIGKYKDCSFQVVGTGTFRPSESAQPFVGKPGQLEQAEEIRIEVIFPRHLDGRILEALKKNHPYEEVAYYLTALSNTDQEVGSGLIGELGESLEPIEFLKRLKVQMNAAVVRHTRPLKKKIGRVAVCGGAGSFLLSRAIQQGADVFISGDFKYHEFFDAEEKIMIADIGHYESEQFTKDLFFEVLSKRFPTFAINFSKTVTNPIFYL